MTDKELHRLRRQDLLQLLLSQSQEVSQQQQQIENLNKQIENLTSEIARLTLKNERKDAVIAKLSGVSISEDDTDIDPADSPGAVKTLTDRKTLNELLSVMYQAAIEFVGTDESVDAKHRLQKPQDIV